MVLLFGWLVRWLLAVDFKLCEQTPRYPHPLYGYQISSKDITVSIFYTHIQILSDTVPQVQSSDWSDETIKIHGGFDDYTPWNYRT